MSLIHTTDDDFRAVRIDRNTLIEIQLEAEERGWSTRWSSVDALQQQVRDDVVLMQTVLRQGGGHRAPAHRCFVLFASAEGGSGGWATIDVDPARLSSLPRLDRDVDVRDALFHAFMWVVNGTTGGTKA